MFEFIEQQWVQTDFSYLADNNKWGYAFGTLYGDKQHIPLTQFGTSYTDTNIFKTALMRPTYLYLYGYVKYEGDDEYYYDEPNKYLFEYKAENNLCPNNHHPHVVDLGLPSGTKWCCCNVGATAPEEYGGYYAWGDVSAYSYDNWDRYVFLGVLGNTGGNIAGTVHDIARVMMGKSWQMPSYEQLTELERYCAHFCINYNGVYGLILVGPTGEELFLPAAGTNAGPYGLKSTGDTGNYWSAVIDLSDDYRAYSFSFGSGSVNYNVSGGNSVRAVCP